MIRRPIQALALFSCLALAACGGAGSTAAPSTAASGAPDALACAPSAAAGTVGVTIKDFEFSPKSVAAKVGDIVGFTNTGAVQHTASGSYLALEPELSRDILGAVRRALGELPPGAPAPIILTQMEIRRYVKRLVEIEQPRVAVLSYQELAPELNIQPVGRIRLAA